VCVYARRERGELASRVAKLDKTSQESDKNSDMHTYGLHSRKNHTKCAFDTAANRQSHSGADDVSEEQTGSSSGTGVMKGWLMARDPATEAVYYCPVALTPCGEPVWELPVEQDSVIFSSSLPQHVREGQEAAAQAAAGEHTYSFIGKMLGVAIVLYLACFLVGAFFFLEYKVGFVSVLVARVSRAVMRSDAQVSSLDVA